jgi:hypothetical protein
MIKTPMSDDELRLILDDTVKILLYSHLSNLSSLHELLPNDKDYYVILYEEKRLSGHWTGLLKYNGIFEFFDPYGIPPDSELSWITMRQRQALNQVIPYLSNLLKKEDYIYNKTDFQQDDSRIQTCGDHVAHRLYCLVHYNMNLEQYQEYMKELKKRMAKPYDYIVADFASNFNVK